ncbi:hypothetical protein D3C84_1039660 [compost metagenome]
MFHPYVGNVNRPDLVGPMNIQLAQQIRINTMLQIAFAQIGARIDRDDIHFPHVASDRVLVNVISFPIHDGSNLSIA